MEFLREFEGNVDFKGVDGPNISETLPDFEYVKQFLIFS